MLTPLFSLIKSSRAVQLALGICFLYWTYLAATTQLLIIFDAVGYEALGRLILDQGWRAYIETGPNREPIYPAIIALAMGIGNQIHASYLSVLILLQMGLSAFTQILTIMLLLKLKVRSWLIAIASLYLTFSPIMTNTTFGILSEVAALPLMLAIILAYSNLWQALIQGKNIKMPTITIAGALLAMTFLKGIFELISPLLFAPFLFFFIRSLIAKNKNQTSNVLRILLIFLITFYVPLISYKCLNKKLNGNFTLTDRGAWAFYGNTHRRMQPLTTENLKVGLSFVAGWGTCHGIYGREKCEFWSYKYSDDVGAKKRQELSSQGFNGERLNSELLRLSKEMISKNPFQYALLSLMESLKMIFSESLALGWAAFPNPITKIYKFAPLAIGIYFLSPVFTLLGLTHLLIYTIRARRKPLEQKIWVITASALFLFFLYTLSYSNFLIVDRYTFPMIPLYAISMVFFAERILPRKLKNKTV